MEEAYAMCDDIYKYTLPVPAQQSDAPRATNPDDKSKEDLPLRSKAFPDWSEELRISHTDGQAKIALEKQTTVHGKNDRKDQLLIKLAFGLMACSICTLASLVALCVVLKSESTESLRKQQSSPNKLSASFKANLNSTCSSEEKLNFVASLYENITTNNTLYLLKIERRLEDLQKEVAVLSNKSLKHIEEFENKLNETSVDLQSKIAQSLQGVLHLSSQTQTQTQTNQSSNLMANKLSQYVTLLYVSKKQLNWVEAEQHCVAMGGHLVTVDSPSKAELVFQKAKSHNLQSHWIGLRANTTENVYLPCNTTRYWVATNEPTNYTDWYPNEPNGCDDGTSTQNINKAPENCVESALEKDSNKWNDAKCLSTQRSFICEINVAVEVHLTIL